MARNNLDIYENILILIVGTLCFYVLRNIWRRLLKNHNETKYFMVFAHHFETKVSIVGTVFSRETS